MVIDPVSATIGVGMAGLNMFMGVKKAQYNRAAAKLSI